MKIYKYLKFEDAIKTLDSNSVILNNPVNYNDPFDCVIKPSEEDEEICYKRILNYYMFKEFSKILLDKKIKIPFWLLWVRWELKLFIKLMRKNPYYDKMPGFDGIMTIVFNKYAETHKDFKKELEKKKIEFSKTIKKAVEYIREMLLVSCFGKDNKSILMWSHYGDKHQGVCVEFNGDSENYKEVRYEKKRQQLDLKMITAVVLGYDFIGESVSKDNPKLLKTLMKLLLTKSRDWQYESEIRTVRSVSEVNDDIYEMEGKHFLKMPKIERIYTGCRISHENLVLLKEKYTNIEIVELEDSDKEFKLIEKQ